MNIFLYIVSVLAGLIGFFTMAVSKSAIHEIYSAIWFLIAAVLGGSAAIVTAVDSLKGKLIPKPIIQKFTPPGGSKPATQQPGRSDGFTLNDA